MPACSGIIEAISVKELPQPDRFGNTHRANLKIGEDWFSYGAIKKPVINIKDGANWVELQKGMEVEFMYDQNGDFKNVKKQSFTITNKEGAQAPAPRQQSAPKQQSQGGSFVNPAALGNAGNYLMHTLEFTHEDMMDDAKVTEGLIRYHKSREQLAKFWEKAEKLAKEDKPPFKETKKPAKKEPEYDEEVEMGYDDDMPI
jgi:hypothetical protein